MPWRSKLPLSRRVTKPSHSLPRSPLSGYPGTDQTFCTTCQEHCAPSDTLEPLRGSRIEELELTLWTLATNKAFRKFGTEWRLRDER